MTTLRTIALFLLALCAFAQTEEVFGPPAPPSTVNTVVSKMTLPKFFLTFGGGLSQYTAPKAVVTLGGGMLVGNGVYTTLHVDESLKFNPVTGKYEPYSVVRAGAQRALLQAGRVALLGSGNFGAATGADQLTGSASLSGVVVIDIRPNTALYLGTSVVREPTITKTGFVYGVVYKIY